MTTPRRALADEAIPDLLERLRRKDRRAMARLLTVVENGTPAQRRLVIAGCHAGSGQATTARVIGVTGPPGAGKSTLINAIATELRTQQRTVAVLAVDPSSPFSGGALLGDSVRMQPQHTDPGIFIRSMAARNHLGGLSAVTGQAVLVAEAAGFDDVLIETAGVGQSEVEVAAAADTTLVALAPGMGDRVQAAKAGVLEIADIFVVNKADQPGAGKLDSELRGMLALGQHTDWTVPIVRTVAARGDGIGELVETLDRHLRHLEDSGNRQRRRQLRTTHTVREIAMDELRRRFADTAGTHGAVLTDLSRRVVAGALDPYAAADLLLDSAPSQSPSNIQLRQGLKR